MRSATRPLVVFLAVASACHAGPAPAAPPPAPSTSAASRVDSGRAPVPIAVPEPLGAVTLSPEEVRIRDFVRAHHEEDVALLERAVNLPSGSQNVEGVRRVAELFAGELRALGFSVRITEPPPSTRRAGHLVAEHVGTRGPRLLLIGHLDTVFEGEGQRFVREDSVARGAGTSDMKGGDVALLAALRALSSAGVLDSARITVVMTGDEESPGAPLEEVRRPLVEAARRSDVALAFEGGSVGRAAVSRRGASSWTLTTSGRQAHSAGVFRTGYGAIYEAARILEQFRTELAGDPTLTFNPGLIAGGTAVTLDSSGTMATVSGKTNIIAPVARVQGDLRFLRESQKDSARARMRAIAARHLAATDAVLEFHDSYPAMPLTGAGRELLARFDAVSRALGYGPVAGDPPESRGAGDISFVAPFIAGIDGLGVSGRGAHSPDESVDLGSLRMAAERAAILMRRLLTDPSLRLERGPD